MPQEATLKKLGVYIYNTLEKKPVYTDDGQGLRIWAKVEDAKKYIDDNKITGIITSLNINIP